MDSKMSGEADDSSDQSENVIIDFTPLCWYGTACYRKNPEHFMRFSHPHLPNDSENETGKEVVDMKIEIGHDATLRTASTPQGHTHDWTAFFRCANLNSAGIFLEKVEFSFPQFLSHPPLVVNQPPFNVTDSGSRSFVMNIDISFKSSDPKKTRIDYDLYLKYNASFSNVRQVNLMILNPPNALRQRLLLAGGVMVQVPDSSTWDSLRPSLPSTSSTNKRKAGNQTTGLSADDECDAFGHLCTTKLRKLEALSPPQKALAEKLISEVLFYAEQKSLTNESTVLLASPSSISPRVNDHVSPIQAVKTEPSEAASSTSAGVSDKYEVEFPSSPVSHQAIKPEVDSPSSSEISHQTTKPEVDSASSSQISHQAIKSEVDSPSSSADVEDCVILQTIKPEKPESEPLVIEIKEEIDCNDFQ